MSAPRERRFAIIRTGNPKSRFSATQEHGSEDSSMQFRRHPWHDDPMLRREELEDDDDEDEDEGDEDVDDEFDDDEDDDEDFDEDDDGFDADAEEEDEDDDEEL